MIKPLVKIINNLKPKIYNIDVGYCQMQTSLQNKTTFSTYINNREIEIDQKMEALTSKREKLASDNNKKFNLSS